jgi:hypothetical protein
MEGDEILERRRRRDDYAGAIAFGAFLILLAVFYLTNPSLSSEARAFIRDFRPVEISQNFWWLEPSSNHPILYSAAEQFCYLFGFVQVAILGLKIAKRSSVREKARTFSDIIFWLGAGYVFGMLSSGALAWIAFLGVLIVLAGVSIVARSTVLLIAYRGQT